MPTDTVSSDIGVGGVLYNGVTGQFVKQIAIANNGTETIYPFLEDANNRTATSGDPTPAPNYTGTGMFDPFDAVNQEYRGYIGYSQVVNGKTVNYAGLLPGDTITIDVPLAFWDAGRIIVTTDGADLFGTGPNGNPFLYRAENTQVTYYGSVSGNTLTFTPIYKSFAYNSANGDYEPSAATWTPPTDLTSGMFVNGPGIPGATTITVGPNQGSVTLNPPANNSITTPAGIYGFTFTSTTPISQSLRYTQPDFTITNGTSSSTNGVVQWYHSLKAENPSNSAPFQLIEMTFRGTFYNPKINVGTGFNYLIGFDTPTKNYISANDFDLVNYDVSYVDSFALPLAVEANSVPIPNTQPPTSAPFGWVGSSQTIAELQAAFTSFTSPGGSLGMYFGGQGYPTYYAPTSVDTIKLPSGQNLFFQSPYNTDSNLSAFALQETFSDGSSVNFPLYALTDGGTSPFSIPAGGSTDTNIPHPTPTQLVLAHSNDADKYKLQLLAAGLAAGEQYVVTSSENGAIPAGTVITSMLTDPMTGQMVGVNLSEPLSSTNPPLYVYTFTRPVSDPIATDIASVWYSWANYYATHVQSTPETDVAGTINSNILDPRRCCAGAGARNGRDRCARHLPRCDHSRLERRRDDHAQPGVRRPERHVQFRRAGGQGDHGLRPDGLDAHQNFHVRRGPAGLCPRIRAECVRGDEHHESHRRAGTANASIPLLGNIIGGNVGPNFLPNQNPAIQSTITNEIKSALRGVPDFTSQLYSNPSQWYPDPALATGGQDFNVFNLDPFIWFIHQQLGLSAYAFALDDDIGDVGAGYATQMDVSVGGLGGLPQAGSVRQHGELGSRVGHGHQCPTGRLQRDHRPTCDHGQSTYFR